MHLLLLTQILPYPPDAGPKVKTWHVLRYLLAQGYRVTLASFIRPEEEPYLDAIREVCPQTHTVPIRRSRLADAGYWLRSQRTGRPFLIERDDLVAMRSLVQTLVAGGDIDVIHADQLTMTQFALPYTRDPSEAADPSRPATVFDAHNAVWTIIARMASNAPAYLKPVLALEARRVKRYEGLIVRRFDHTLAVTTQDQAALLEACRDQSNGADPVDDRLTVVPIAVDTQSLRPTHGNRASRNIMTLGTLHYPPNADGIRWFAREIFPLVQQQHPEVTLTIIGKNPPTDFLQLAHAHPQSVEVTGYVPDLTPYCERAALMVVPVRAGGGMRVRILEAFARAMPVVTTTIGLEGIQARPGEDVLVADTPQDFAAAVVRLLQDPSLRASLAANGRRLVEERYDWQVVLQTMDRVYQQVIPIPTQ